MRFDVCIVGAGLAGATAAVVAAQAGKRVLIIEKSQKIAGNCYDYRSAQGITVHKYGPHIFHTESKKCWDFVNQYAQFSSYQHRVLSFIEGNYYPFPINRETLNQIYGTHLLDDDVPAFLAREISQSKLAGRITNFREAVINQVGEKLYSLFFENYTRKQWECAPEKLLAELAGRIPVRTNGDNRYFTDRYQGLPQKGYTAMVAAMLDHSNITVLTNVDYFTLKDDIEALLTVYTGPLDRFFDYMYGKLQYRSIRLEFTALNMAQYQEVAVVNYPNDYDWTRISEFKHLTGESADSTVICKEYPLRDGEPFYVVPNRVNQDMREKYMAQVRKAEINGKFLFVGRLAEYKYYNMDQVILSALDKMEKYFSNAYYPKEPDKTIIISRENNVGV